jgi:L-iditol 2-dehydrogenase
MKMMKAAIWTTDGTFEIRNVPKPEIDKQNEVLTRVKASGICGSDLHYWKVQNHRRVGKIIGHELAGEVIDVGEKVTNVKIGDRVAIESLVECRECRWCRIGKYHLCTELTKIRYETLSRGFSQYVKGPSEKFIKLLNHVKTEWATLLDCYAVNVHAFQIAELKMYETVAIIGQGPMGLTMTDLANAVGVKTIAIALRDFSLQVSKNVGAWKTVNSNKVDPVKRVKELTDGYGVDTVFLQAGGKNPNPLLQALKMIKKVGKVMIIGLPTGRHLIEGFNTNLLQDERMMRYVNSFAYWDEYSENMIALDYLSRGKLHPEEIITHRFPLEKINEAFETAINKKKTNAIKVLIIQD